MVRALNRVAAVVAALVAAVGLLRTRPELCFRVPEVGFALYSALTFTFGPPYVVTDCYKDIDDWTRDGDVIVSTVVKGGTTWMLYLAHLVRIRGDEERHPWHEVNTNTPWPAFRHHPGQSWQELKGLMNTTVLAEGLRVKQLWDHEDYLFRVFKAHEAPVDSVYGAGFGARDLAVLPLHSMAKRVKFIAMYRDLPDIMASFLPFVNSHTEEFRALWGGMPPRVSSVESMLQLMFLPSVGLGRQIVTYLRIWWRNRHCPNVLLLHYSDAVRDLVAVTKKVARFTDSSLSEEAIAAIAAKASFASMKKMGELFSYRLWAHPGLLNGTATAVVRGKQLRRGAVGDGAALLSAEQLRRVRAFLRRELADDPELLRWGESGGEFS